MANNHHGVILHSYEVWNPPLLSQLELLKANSPVPSPVASSMLAPALPEIAKELHLQGGTVTK